MPTKFICHSFKDTLTCMQYLVILIKFSYLSDRNQITNADGEALKYLTDIKWSRKDDFRGFMLEFCFDKNPFFTNSVLTKTYQFLDEDETILHKATG